VNHIFVRMAGLSAAQLAPRGRVPIWSSMTREPDLHAIRRSLEIVGRLSDGIIQIGPFGLGLEAVLDWIPGVGEVYGFGAAAFIIVQGVRARAPLPTLLLAGTLMFARTAISAIPLAGPLAADVLTLHRFSARLIIAAIDRRLAAQGGGAPAGPRQPLWRSRGGFVAA
jgi:hypothetical protein